MGTEKEIEMSGKVKIKDRIVSAIMEHGEFVRIEYYALARFVFPRDKYPNAWNHPTKGGPPGCYMVLSRAIMEHEFHIQYGDSVAASMVSLGKNRS